MTEMALVEFELESTDAFPGLDDKTALMPRVWLKMKEFENATFVKVTLDGKSKAFRTSTREGSGNGADQKDGESKRIFVSKTAFDAQLKPHRLVKVEMLQARGYRYFQLFHTSDGILTLTGAALASIGILIGGSLSIGEVYVLIEIDKAKQAMLLSAATAMQLIGGVLVLWKSVMNSKF